MRIYLDVCCLNRPFDDHAQERVRLEAEAVLTTLRRIEEGQWDLVGSEAVEFELSQISDWERQRRVRALAQLAKSRQSMDGQVLSRAQTLVASGLKSVDALHVACTEVARATVFLTTDDRLLRALGRAQVAGIPVNNPLPWLYNLLS